jgi:opacity protein-like surface antigen
MKKQFFIFFFILLSLALSSETYANWNGFYLGGQIGLSLLQGSKKIKITDTVAVPNTQKNSSKHLSNFSYLVGAHAGYLRTVNQTFWVLAGELYVNFLGNKIKKTATMTDTAAGGADGAAAVVPAVTYTITMKPGVGFVFLVGNMINPRSFIYAKLGIEYNRFNIHHDAGAVIGSISTNKSVSGYPLGLGVMFKIKQRNFIRFEYTFVSMKSITAKKGEAFTGTYKPSQQKFCIGYSWIF